MANGDIDEFRAAFTMGCPKFLSPTTVVYEGGNQSKEPLLRQCQAFLEGIASQIAVPILRGYLKLYTSLPTQKLASFMDVPAKEFDTFLGKLLSFKMLISGLGKGSHDNDNEEIEGAPQDIDFYVDKDMIFIADTKVSRRICEHFIKHIHKLIDMQKSLRS